MNNVREMGTAVETFKIPAFKRKWFSSLKKN